MTLHETIDSQDVSPTRAATFHDLMASIGYLLFQWSLLDHNLDEEIDHLRRAGGETICTPARARTLNERLAEWRALLGRGRRRKVDHFAVESIGERILDFQRLRNLVATGFVSASPDAAEPAIRCAHGASRRNVADAVEMNVADILSLIEAMEACRSEMALLRDMAAD